IIIYYTIMFKKEKRKLISCSKKIYIFVVKYTTLAKIIKKCRIVMKPRFIPFFVLMFACIVNCNGSPTLTHPVKLSAPRLVTPNNNANGVTRPFHFSWQGVGDAEIYELVIVHDTKKIFDKRVKGTRFTPNKIWPAMTRYHWRVRAIVSGHEGKWSQTLRFTTATTTDSSAVLIQGI